jgi:hypothetical protein
VGERQSRGVGLSPDDGVQCPPGAPSSWSSSSSSLFAFASRPAPPRAASRRLAPPEEVFIEETRGNLRGLFVVSHKRAGEAAATAVEEVGAMEEASLRIFNPRLAKSHVIYRNG